MNKVLIVVLALIALVVGILVGRGLSGGDDSAQSGGDEKKILYWVAPMDPNYRREGPGKSPMGMDLVPVYEGEEEESAPGTVSISPQVENNLGVRTAAAQQGPVATQVDTVGLVQLDEDKLHHVHTRLSGWVHKSWVKAVGDRVRKGQPLVEIYSPELVKAQSELVAALESGNRTLIEATRERLNTLGVPADQVREVSRTREVSQTITLHSPADGYVNEFAARDGMYITPATTLMSIGPLDTVWVEGELFPKQGGQVQVGDTATLQGDFAPGRSWTGKLVHILPDLDPETRTLRVRVLVENRDKSLRPGMFVRLQLEGPKVNTLTVPRGALIRTGDMDRLVIAEGAGRYRSVRVRVGRELGQRVEILAGIAPGTQVVTSAQFLLDSESSISADLQRIEGKSAAKTGQKSAKSDTAWAEATVLSMPDDNHYARLDHGPVPEWDWPGMVMGFYVAEAAQNDLRKALESGAPLRVQMHQREDGKYEVIATRAVAGDAGGDMDHSQMGHGDMDHGDTEPEMDHHGQQEPQK
ncbi:efflux RND transporter periplasmic adaptor subunit [Microbulbifer hydrolyticus]|uniref:Cu(I)/Ag(I) efflux system membrane fusion protein n=1 Tax=Microbulbifer hydrolyticus TaxID=48074 RepID=A0A6P1T6Y7_9GAMM|nr:efflux RND transporter periplasmic adaptor subunit [Microbulbifer hydrolyticus]MBB5211700.1 Cu(I)/Ag(I) efflux system membrane fusion protein [Microbulbifer hydrolyticus]QHQ37571.1 efflux RND transporter periplasmic adaptor subunit [Microbulbifer hydrolyticus]